jgi:hypothetical protein
MGVTAMAIAMVFDSAYAVLTGKAGSHGSCLMVKRQATAGALWCHGSMGRPEEAGAGPASRTR